MNEKNEFGYTAEEYKKFRKYALIFLILFSLLYASVYCMRLNMTNATGIMTDDGIINEHQAGILSGLLFWFYGAGQLISGKMSEKISPSLMLGVAVAGSALINVIFGFQDVFWVMAVLWALNGFFQSMMWSPGQVMIARWWPGSSRGFGLGFALAFSGFGQAISYVAVVLSLTVFPKLGWRAAFLFPFVLPAIFLIIFLIFARSGPEAVGLSEYKEPDPGKSAAEAEMKEMVEKGNVLTSFALVLKTKGFTAWIIMSFMGGLVRYGLCTWVPLYFSRVYGINPTDGLLQAAILPVGMGIGTLAVPWFTDRFCPNNRMPAALISAVVSGIGIGVMLLLDPTVPLQLIIVEIMLFITGFAVYAATGTSWTIATDVGGRVLSGTASGILNFSSYMGAAVQSVLYGFVLEKIGWTMVFVTIIIACAVQAVICLGKCIGRKRNNG